MKLPQQVRVEKSFVGKIQIAVGILLGVGVLYWYQGANDKPASTPPMAETPVASQSATENDVPTPAAPAAADIAQDSASAAAPAVSAPAKPEIRTVVYEVKSGDTLEGIFNSQNLSIQELYSILEADEPYLVIDVIQPGDKLTFRIDDQNRLEDLSLVIDPSKTVSYQRDGDNGFVYKEDAKPTNWITQVVHGKVNGSFYTSARRVGLSEATTVKIGQLLKTQINFRRDLRAGDEFDVVMSEETVNGTPFGEPRVEGVQIHVRKKAYSAFLHSDGTYYDAKGDSLTPALLRFPTSHRFRVSSNFNPHRLNPVSHRVAPHNGVDFAMPIGTPVLATGDGVVARTAHHRYAGNYIVLDESGPYSSRYLHLSKILVHKGQHVKRGQKIGLSGNTGRSTGPHLHYELHIKDKPVNPLTAKIPTLKSVPAQEMAEYRQRVQSMEKLMSDHETQVVQNLDTPSEQDKAKASADDING